MPLTNPLPSRLHQTPFALGDDEIKLLAPSGIDLVPSAGPGKLQLPTLFVMQLDTTAGAYGNVGDLLSIALGGAISPIVEPLVSYTSARSAFAGMPGAICTLIAGMGPLSLSSDPESTDWGQIAYASRLVAGVLGDNPIQLRIDNYTAGWGEDLGNFTDGHPDNTLKGVVEYRIFNLETQLFE